MATRLISFITELALNEDKRNAFLTNRAGYVDASELSDADKTLMKSDNWEDIALELRNDIFAGHVFPMVW